MNNPPLELKKARDFGQILNSTFVFIKQNFKPLFKALIVYAGPFILLQAIAMGYYQSSIIDMSFFIRNFNLSDFFEKIFFNLSLVMIASILSYTMILTTVYSFIKLYAEKGKDGFEFDEIGKLIARNFFKVLGANIVVFLVVCIGCIFCFIPGIYLGVSLSLIYAIMIIEDLSFGSAFSRSFSLTHYSWWWTLLLLIVIYMIVGVASYILAVPQMIISFVWGFNKIAHGGSAPDTIKDMMLIVTAVITFINALLGVIPFITLALQYFNIVEKKESPSLLKKIDQLGQTQ
ncbi:MAG: hypothetical protein HY958_11010 [Bacteroidia bacterium]|nr:hypothetical protein [Bacteroidia bacterium]